MSNSLHFCGSIPFLSTFISLGEVHHDCQTPWYSLLVLWDQWFAKKELAGGIFSAINHPVESSEQGNNSSDFLRGNQPSMFCKVRAKFMCAIVGIDSNKAYYILWAVVFIRTTLMRAPKHMLLCYRVNNILKCTSYLVIVSIFGPWLVNIDRLRQLIWFQLQCSFPLEALREFHIHDFVISTSSHHWPRQSSGSLGSHENTINQHLIWSYLALGHC